MSDDEDSQDAPEGIERAAPPTERQGHERSPDNELGESGPATYRPPS